jgi:deoxyribodipyrimidine photolyase-related protein
LTIVPATTITFVAPGEYSRALARLPKTPRDDVVVLLIESVQKGSALPWHRRKLVLVLSALRHFAAELIERGYRVDHRIAPSYRDGIVASAREHGSTRVVSTQGREWDIAEELAEARGQLAELGCELELHPDRGFFSTREDFAAWATGRKELRMEWFYRDRRRASGVLMEPDGKPTGGEWNYDAENRKPWPKGKPVPAPISFPPDAITQATMDQVAGWQGRWGRVEGFDLPVTRRQAKELLRHFVAERLDEFGPYEDAMVAGEYELLHSGLSSALNVGLLTPQEVVQAAEAAYRAGHASLASTEGFIRQILGWREFVYGYYWWAMPGLRTVNALEAKRSLPVWYWAPDGEQYGGTTAPQCEMNCLSDSVRQVRDQGRVHHIPRLMVQSNFATLLGVEPAALSIWFWAAFTDAYEWVELPNVMGMATWADGGAMASKPYVSSGAYIDRMSNHCAGCRYDVKKRTGPDACPFNYLYWDFIGRNADRFAEHPRMGMMVRQFGKLAADEREKIAQSAADFKARVP